MFGRKSSDSAAIDLVYSIRDRVADDFGPPFVCKNRPVAVRAAKTMLDQARIVDVRDYELYEIGTFNGHTGEILPLSEREMIPMFVEGFVEDPSLR